MKRTLALIFLALAACGTQGPVIEEGGLEQAVVTETSPEEIAMELADVLKSCVDLPDGLTAQWIKERLIYTNGCFSSWAVNIDISCELGGHPVEGSVLVAGPAMDAVPRTGLFIRARAAAAALVDLGNALNGNLFLPRVDANVSGLTLTLDACAAPIQGGLHCDLDLVMDNDVLGVADIHGAADLSLSNGIFYADYLVSLDAEPPVGPTVSGELSGTSIERNKSDLCPLAGEVRFVGSIGDESAEVVMDYIGDGQGMLTMPDGETVGPLSAPRCE